jgi:hypothetical protein
MFTSTLSTLRRVLSWSVKVAPLFRDGELVVGTWKKASAESQLRSWIVPALCSSSIEANVGKW